MGCRNMSTANDRLQARVTKLYIDMRLKRISKLNWMIETEETLNALRQLDSCDIAAELFYAQLMMTKEAYDVVEEIMERAAEWLRTYSGSAPACHAYYLYLTTLMKDDAAYDARVTAKLTELARKNPSVWQIEWLLYYVDRDLAKEPLEQYHFLKRMFLKGCRSPLMYLEARVLLERNPTFLYEFSEFEVQLMVFMIRYAGMSQRVSDILAEYMLQRTDYRYIYLYILFECYEVAPSRRLLEGICRMMVLGGCAGEKFTLWYRKGIAEGVHVPGLNEAFMKSLPVEQWYLDGEELVDIRRIPSEVIAYFAHASELDSVRTAYLYAIVHKYRENWMSMYRLYEPLIEPYVMDQLYKGNVNAGLAYLYEHILQPDMIPEECLERFTNICYSCKITNLPIEAGTLLVRYAHCKGDVRVPFTNREVCLPLYGEQYTLYVETYNGCEMSVYNAEIVPLMNTELWINYLTEQTPVNILFHLAQTETAVKQHALEQGMVSAKQVLFSESISMEFKETVAVSMLPYWDINGQYEEILSVVPHVFTEFGGYSKEKESVFWKRQYAEGRIGIYGVQFLMDHYEGTLLESGSIFSKAKSLGIETAHYAEHLICWMLKEGKILPQHLEILDSYCKDQPDQELVQEYLEFEAAENFMNEKVPESAIIQKQAQLTLEGFSFSIIAQLAFLQKLVQSGVGSMGAELTEVAAGYVRALLKQNIYFSWMQSLKVICTELECKSALQVLEYRGEVSGPVWVRYRMYVEGKDEAQSMQSEVMEAVCEGLYAKEFLLFFGERLHYEIFSLDGTEHKLLKQGILQKGHTLSEQGGTRFERLNRMLAFRNQRDNLELYQELEAYYGQSAIVEQLFDLK